jgi:hypothetical protein
MYAKSISGSGEEGGFAPKDQSPKKSLLSTSSKKTDLVIFSAPLN